MPVTAQFPVIENDMSQRVRSMLSNIDHQGIAFAITHHSSTPHSAPPVITIAPCSVFAFFMVVVSSTIYTYTQRSYLPFVNEKN